MHKKQVERYRKKNVFQCNLDSQGAMLCGYIKMVTLPFISVN